MATAAIHDRKRYALRRAGFAQGWGVSGFSLRPWDQPARVPRHAGVLAHALSGRRERSAEPRGVTMAPRKRNRYGKRRCTIAAGARVPSFGRQPRSSRFTRGCWEVLPARPQGCILQV